MLSPVARLRRDPGGSGTRHTGHSPRRNSAAATVTSTSRYMTSRKKRVFSRQTLARLAAEYGIALGVFNDLQVVVDGVAQDDLRLGPLVAKIRFLSSPRVPRAPASPSK